MQYITIVEDSYEKAVKKARSEYGESVRIHSRRDFTTPGGLFSRRAKKCEIICYITDNPKAQDGTKDKDISEFEKEAKTPDPEKISKEDRLNTEIHRMLPGSDKALELLELNHISGPLKTALLNGFTATPDRVSAELGELILKNTSIDYQLQVHPTHFMVFLGPTGTGKTTTLAKMAHLYRKEGKKVAIITLDSYRVGAYEQVKAFGDAFSIPVELVRAEDELIKAIERFSWHDLVLVDTMGLSHKDIELNLKLKGLTAQFRDRNTSFILTISPSMKEEDLLDHYMRYKEFKPSALIVTKLDETETIGNVLSFSYRTGLPLLFFTDGQKVPDDLEKASTSHILENLRGFGFDMLGAKAQITNSAL